MRGAWIAANGIAPSGAGKSFAKRLRRVIDADIVGSEDAPVSAWNAGRVRSLDNHDRLPLTALRAFEATARLGSLTSAAVELKVTHAAISHHLRVLETYLGVEVFHRVGRHVELSDAGHLLLPALNDAFRHMHDAVGEVMRKRQPAEVELVAPPVFAARWLLPRLRRFRSGHPDIVLRVTPSREAVSPTSRRDSRLVVGCGVGDWRGADIRLLLPILLEPVCTPQLAREHSIARPADVVGVKRIDSDLDPAAAPGADWRAWMAAADLGRVEESEHEALRDAGLAVQAAIDGRGLVLADRNLCVAEIDDGRLCAPLGVRLRHAFSYWLLTPPAPLDEDQAAVCDWLMDEAAQCPNNPRSAASAA